MSDLDAKTKDAVRRAVAELLAEGGGVRAEDLPRALRERLKSVAVGEADIKSYADEVRRELARKGG